MKEQKSIIRTLTNRSFKANTTRNLIAVFAIILTTVMFTSLFVLSQSMVDNIRNMNFQQAGYNSHLSSGTMTDADAEKIITHQAVRDYGKSAIIGVAENKELTGRQVEIRYADENYARSSFSYPTTGTMPVRENEIALDTITLDKMGLPYELGQEITLEWRKDLTSDEYTTSTFVLSGYWDGNSAAMASMAWVSEAFVQIQCADIDQETQLANGQVLGTVMLHLDLHNDDDLEGTAERIVADTGLSDVFFSPNAAYDATMNQNIIREVLPMAICMVLVFASGYLIIYNIFQISVAGDIRFYGRLKTLGTTKKQLKTMIYGQANRLSLIGIPIGLGIGYLLGAVLVPVMITGTTGEAKAAVNPYIFIGSAAFAYLTVLISCMRPAKIAGKVSPMEALHYTDAGTVSTRKIKKSTGGASIPKMALANLGRNTKRTITVICSLTLGLVLLSCVFAKNASFDIDKYMGQTVISDFEVEDSSISSTFGTYNPYGTTISPELVQNIEGLSGLEATGRLYSQVFTHQIGASALENIQTYYHADERIAYIEATDSGLAEAYHDMIESGECVSMMYGVDGLILDAFAQDGRILDGTFDKDAFLSGGYVVMEAATGAEDSEKETQPTYSVGDMVELDGRQYEVMAIVADIPTITEGVNSGTQDFLSFYLPADAFRETHPNNTLRKLFFDVAEEHQPQAENMLVDHRDNVDKSLNYTAKSTLIEHYQEQTRANTVMGFAISLIIAFVGMLNFINSMLTAIISRRKEFAMIQSIGMTKRQLRRMLIDEGLYYAGSTLLASYVLGALAVGIVVRMMVSTDWTATFHFTLLPLVICTPVLIALATLIPYICFKNLEKQSIVERLRATD
ncbi:ABC transporter permease [Bifidobacterium eulemuris]|uniref:ABC transporter permease n=1 Tax=Bifidobacterium eulemuris TaxID=1765219 RepID=A0A261GD04_9BIFI|nr:ABC transporter permease [Bifidobacterium eulemuris]OZG69321.1 ABC transporter permease [Bifidobacterium eulemuris]QOL31181.1 ABC transporter permease [Bifidobacterium eulemuris]